MVEIILSKALRIGRATALAVGVAVMLALTISVASMALGANGKPFLLGRQNVASAVSTLIKQGPGPALRLKVGGGPPLAVNSGVRVANLNAARAGRADSAARADFAVNADKLDGKDQSAFLGKTEKAADSDQLDGKDSDRFVERGSASTNQVTALSYFMNTATTQDYVFGQIKLRTNGIAGQFQVCNVSFGTTGSRNFVAYVNGTRTAGTFSLNGGCSQVFDAGAGGDFQVSSRRAQIFGTHSGDGTTNENYSLIGFSQL